MLGVGRRRFCLAHLSFLRSPDRRMYRSVVAYRRIPRLCCSAHLIMGSSLPRSSTYCWASSQSIVVLRHSLPAIGIAWLTGSGFLSPHRDSIRCVYFPVLPHPNIVRCACKDGKMHRLPDGDSLFVCIGGSITEGPGRRGACKNPGFRADSTTANVGEI